MCIKGALRPFLFTCDPDEEYGPERISMTQSPDQLQSLLAPAIEALGSDVSLWGIEFTSGPASALLRVYIDAGERAVGIEDCEAVSREISALLDVEDPIPGNYTLEVSSPGMERPLFTPEQFERYLGETVKITLGMPLENNRRRVQGVISAVAGNDVTIDTEAGPMTLAHGNIQRARLVPNYNLPARPGRKPGAPRRKPT
jgi:ribosome maturation factor RimP